MAYEFRLPDAGEGIAEGEIRAWHVEVGEYVKAHDLLLEVETDKALVEIPSPVSGVMLERSAEVGDVVAVGTVLAVFDTGAEKSEEPPTSPKAPDIANDIPVPGGRSVKERRPGKPTAPAVQGSVGVVGQLEEAPDESDGYGEPDEPEKSEEPEEQHAQPVQPSLIGARVEILPRDRLLAQTLGVLPDTLRGTGPGGRVTEADVRRASQLGQPPPAAGKTAKPKADTDEHGPVERQKVLGVRRKVAEAMVRSLSSAAQVTTTDEADVTRLASIRERERAVAKAEGVHLTYLPFIIKAVVGALKRDPYLNSSFDDDAGEIVVKGYYNIGIATETRDGLIVPVVKGADRLSVLELAAQIEKMTTLARKRELSVAQLKGATFTLSNFGAIGGIFATPILNTGEAALLGIGRIRERPVACDGAIRIRMVMPLSLTFDHRIVDGATAQHFLSNVIRRIEDPDLLLLGI
jgi:pyruvate dehydrogenase E2 component (dihydrolipoamide acetyltransferase)